MLYPYILAVDASPKAVSGRTSYYQTRLAFHSLPQVIPEDCTTHGFGPPPNFHQGSTCSRQARLASGLEHSINALLTLAFATSAPHKGLDTLNIQTRWLVLQKARRHPCGLRLFVSKWFQVLFHRGQPPTFHLSLTVLVHYR